MNKLIPIAILIFGMLTLAVAVKAADDKPIVTKEICQSQDKIFVKATVTKAGHNRRAYCRKHSARIKKPIEEDKG